MVDFCISELRSIFEKIEDPRGSNCRYPLADNLMAAFAMFHQKDPSLLAFGDLFPTRKENMHSVYKLHCLPQDSSLRSCLDKVPPQALQGAFGHLLGRCKEKQLLAEKQVLDGQLLISIDGTGYFSSSKVCCDHCLTKNHSNGTTTYHHQMLAAVITHPHQKTVLPVWAEAIANEDGAKKNDCERNAFKRLLPQLQTLLPDEKKVIVLDALYADGPTLRSIKEGGMNAIISIKEGYVLEQVKALKESKEGREPGLERLQVDVGKGETKVLRWVNNLILNGANPDIFVGYFEVEHYRKGGSAPFYKGAWITTLPLNADTVAELEGCGRSRWRIENETFNTLKNQNFHLEHNYGHGKKYLSTVFCLLTLLAFFVDQIAALKDEVFQRAKAKFKTYRAFVKVVSSIFDSFDCSSMRAIYAYMAGDTKIQKPKIE